ncbi:hypothetical protein LCGC14_2001320 [marine sediment metagenome]|uniref:Uncharacterized protein n=1 Tax=marine sediment metagenome TaxID=412755 RepID=A0A0F9I098_9ZZZZ
MIGVNIPEITAIDDMQDKEISAPVGSEEPEIVTHEDWDALKVQKPDPSKVSDDKQTQEVMKVIDRFMVDRVGWVESK